MNPETAVRCRCELGENPLWDERERALLWTDITGGALYRYVPSTGIHSRMYSGPPVGGFTLQADGSLLLFQANKISRREPDGRIRLLRTGVDPGMRRFNDVIADPRGRVYAGTIGKDDVRGGLFRIDRDGSIRCLFRGTGCSNGMGFSPDERYFYWTDSTASRIFRFRYDADSGDLSERTVWVTVPEAEGIPDGMTVDSQGFVWSARWDGHAVVRLDPLGREVERIPFPAAKVSSVTFGGPELDELFVTTARGESEDPESPAGDLYHLRVEAHGMLPFRSQILLQAAGL
jgi:sugar lactone lactonase YvrE